VLLTTLAFAASVNAQDNVVRFILEKGEAVEMLETIDDPKLMTIDVNIRANLLRLVSFKTEVIPNYKNPVILTFQASFYQMLLEQLRTRKNLDNQIRYDLCGILSLATGAATHIPCLEPWRLGPKG